MFDFKVMMDPAIELFHSRNKSELLGDEPPYDLEEVVAETNLGPRDLNNLPQDQLVSTLQQHGLEPALINASSLIAEIKQALRT